MSSMKLNQILKKEHEEIDQLLEGVLDMPADTNTEQQIDILIERLAAAKRALGITNRLQNPEERKKHRGRVMGFLNQLRAMLARITKSLESVE